MLFPFTLSPAVYEKPGGSTGLFFSHVRSYHEWHKWCSVYICQAIELTAGHDCIMCDWDEILLFEFWKALGYAPLSLERNWGHVTTIISSGKCAKKANDDSWRGAEKLSPLKTKIAYQRPSSPYFSVRVGGKPWAGRRKSYKRGIISRATGQERKE